MSSKPALPIPPPLDLRPRDAHGRPIPVTVFMRADGTPDFRINDLAMVAWAIRFRRCAMCGMKMGAHVYFIGGPACAEYGIFADPPMHQACALYALQACPHLASAKGRYSPLANLPEDAKLIVANVSPEKADRFALMHGQRYAARIERAEDGFLIQAELPWLDVQWFRDGAEIEPPA